MDVTYTTLPQPQYITLLALNLRFTRAERDAIRASTDGDVSDAMYLMEKAQYIDLANPLVISTLSLLETKTLIATGRAAAILAQPITDAERA